MSSEAANNKSTTPERSRAVFSQEDFELIRVAVAHYLQVVKEQPEAMKYSNLYHRLGRIS